MNVQSGHRNILRFVLRNNVSSPSLTRRRLLKRLNSTLSVEIEPEEQTVSKTRTRSSRKLKTVKEYAELPERLLSLTGLEADPLPPWNGGLGVGTRRKPRNASARSLERLEGEPSQLEDGTDNTPVTQNKEGARKRRSRKKRSLDASDEDSIVHISGENNVKMADGLANRRHPRNQLAKEILENLDKFPHCILLTRVGQFYESYFDQAQEVSRLLSIKLTKRTWDDQRIWMCGFPLMHLDKYLKILVQQHNRSVAMCEEFRKPRDPNDDVLSKPTFERRVVRILTPGTLIDEPFLNPYENNFLLAIAEDDTASQSDIGLAWIDVSTGEFFTRNTSLESLKDHIARISPREVVLDRTFESQPNHPILGALQDSYCVISFAAKPTGSLETRLSNSSEVVDDIVNPSSMDEPSDVFSAAETSAIAVLNFFLQSHLLEHAPSALRPLREEKSKRMQIDAHTLKGLEIRESLREGGSSGSLMSSIKRTVTTSGTRLLSRWLCAPSTSVEEILARQSLVNLFRTRQTLREDLVELLKGAEDAMRISQKFLLGKGGVEDLVSIRSTITIWDAIKNRISLEKECERNEGGDQFANEEWQALDQLMTRMMDLSGLARRIELAIEVRQKEDVAEESEDIGVPEPDATTTSEIPKFLSLPGIDTKWTIKPQFSIELASLHERLNRFQDDKNRLEKRYQEQYIASSLTLRHSPSHGLHIHVSKPRKDSVRLDNSRVFTQLAENKSTKTYFNQEWFALGNSILETVASIYAAEREAFLMLRNETNVEATAIRKNARILDELDVTSAFANLASDMNFVRPTISDDSSFYIENGRHPTVELGLLQAGRMFTPNTVSMSDSSRLHIVTGPNMAGKSTYLRQTALVAILAQTGSFVPADSAHIGLVDKVFSRIGAKDDLFRDRSTFMVEMLESAEILKNATEKSLVIMDEVGRGTTVQDGLAIAFATVQHLYHVNKSRALFATHFHELVDMLDFSEASQSSEIFPQLAFYCTDIDETEDGLFTYSHRMRRGVNRDSHGLKVAQLAGMPPLAIDIAEKALSAIKMHKESSTNVSSRLTLRNLGRQLAAAQTFPDIEHNLL